MDWKISRLTSDFEFGEFDCDDKDLNEFLLDESKHYLTQFISVTYLIETEKGLAAYFSVSNDRISAVDLPTSSQWKKFQKCVPHSKRGPVKNFPAVKIGRLAVSTQFKGQNLGARLMDYIKGLFYYNNKTGCRFIIVDSYNTSVGFYERQGFAKLSNQNDATPTTLMYFDLAALG